MEHRVKILLTPLWDGEKITEVQVELEAEWNVKKGEELFSINLITIFKPFTPLCASIAVKDDNGNLEYATKEIWEKPVKKEQYLAERNSVGRMRIDYRLQLDAAGRNPVFDLGYEKGGMTGSGMTFMPAFPKGDYLYDLDWDLSHLPSNAQGVWSFGSGRITRNGDGSLLQQTFYAAGELDCVKIGNFAYYWMKNNRILETAVDTAKIFLYENEFFEDKGDIYTVIARHTAELEGRAGGTALMRSYMYLYQTQEQLDPVWLKFLFAHEMVHNWIHLDDTPFGTCTWYVEGMAEYYSVLLLWRMGISSLKGVCAELNKRAKQYYENPAITCSNAEAGAGLMADKEKTRIPYGRGFFYLMYADGCIRKASGGKCSLDDAAKILRRRWEEDQTIQNEAWLEAYGAYVGYEQAKKELEEISKGGEVIPDPACFEGKIKCRKIQGVQRETQKACAMWEFFEI